MKRILIITTFLLSAIPYIHGQAPRITITENFDGSTVSFTSTPANAWITDSDYAFSSPNSYRTRSPNRTGNIVILESPPYDFSSYSGKDACVQLRFKHICKVSPNDITRIEYRIPGNNWQTLNQNTYQGNASNYDANKAFSASSYPQWLAGDSLAMPAASWWEEEIFDVSFEVKGEQQVQFRFVLEHGAVPGTQISYGWLIDDFTIIAANHQLKLPVIEFMASCPKDTVHKVGPYDIHAKVKTTTNARIKTPWLKYMAIYNNNVVETDSVLMENISGDSLWRASIKQFVMGTEVSYSITGEDTTGNYTTLMLRYVISMSSMGVGSEIIIQDNGTNITSNNYPFMFNQGYSQSMALYPVSEIGNKAEGLIEKIALRVRSAANTGAPIRIWLKTVPVSKTTWDASTDNLGWTALTQKATLVYDGVFHFATTGWVDIPLDRKFNYSGKENLVVLFEQYCGGSSCGMTRSAYFYNSGTAVDQFWIKASNYNPPNATTSLYIGEDRPDLRIGILGISDSNSVALRTIDYPNESSIVAGSLNPVVVTIHNRGFLNLDSAMIYWRVNSGEINEYAWKGGLPWDFKSQDTIGYFIPRTALYDTLTVWIAMPNGQVDTITEDDSLSVVLFGCAGQLEGDYSVGAGGFFPSFDAAVMAMKICGVKGNVRLMFKEETFTQNLTFSSFINDLMGPYRLAISSAPGDSVVFKPASGVGITLKNIRNFAIENITIDVTAGTHGIQLLDSCFNIVINNCRIVNYQANKDQNHLICRSTGPHRTDSLRITNNLLDGGHYGIYVWGSSATNSVTNIVIENNVLQNQYSRGIYLYAANCLSVSYNTLFARKAGDLLGDWYGIYMWTSLGPVIGNRIVKLTATDGITTPTGIYLSYYHRGDNPMGLVANNEIIINASGYYSGIHSNSSNSRILHNSIYAGGTGAARVINIGNSANTVEVKNNNVMVTSTSPNASPIYLVKTDDFTGVLDVNSNNYYASNGNIGYASGIIKNKTDWVKAITTDTQSVSIRPDFVDSSSCLQLNDTTGLTCSILSSVPKDIDGFFRIGTITTMGCYEAVPPFPANGMLEEIIGLQDGSIAGQTASLKVVLVNTGADTIKEVNIGWSLNGQVSPNTVTKNMQLPRMGRDTITLGEITYPADDLITKIWINDIGGQQDPYPDNDTVSTTTFVCNLFAGPYVLGEGEEYSSIDNIFDFMKMCGVSGDIQLLLKGGTYNENLVLPDFSSVMGPYTLAITSAPGENVIIKPLSGVGITLSNISNLTLDSLTIDVTTGTHGIEFLDGCTNIVINNCQIVGSQTNSTSYLICKETATGKVDGLRITHNFLDGGYYGIYLRGSGINPVGNVVIDSNRLENQFYSGIYPLYANCKSVSYNRVLSGQSGSLSPDWRGISMKHSVGPITGNRIMQRNSTSITTPRGIFLDSCLQVTLVNNEIILGTTGTFHGIYSHASNARILHNSVYAGGSGNARGIYIANTSNSLEIRNNNIVCLPPSAHPLYLEGTSYLSQYNINSNNYYAPSYIGYASGAIMNLSAWKQVVLTDVSSVQVLPSFVNEASSLKLSDYTPLRCPSLADVRTDIEGSPRYPFTSMGAYTMGVSNTVKVEIVSQGWQEKTVLNMKQPMAVLLTNACNMPVTSAVFEWELNGIPQTPYQWTTSSPVGIYDTVGIKIGSFAVPRDSSKVTIWVSSVNGHASESNKVTDSCYYVPLSELAEPLITDTLGMLFFDVPVEIFTRSGAPATPPQMEVTTRINGGNIFYTTIPMTLNNGKWIGKVPQQYYNSTVIYSVTIEDTVGNIHTITDSTFLAFLPSSTSQTRVGTSTDNAAKIPPVDVYEGKSWSKSLYLSSEMALLPNHTHYITELSWELYAIFDGSSPATYTLYDQSIYLKAVPDQDLTDPSYLTWTDPIQDGATLIWSGDPRLFAASVNVLNLAVPFELPPNMNLLVYWVNDDNNVNTKTELSWGYTTIRNMAVFNYGAVFPTGNGWLEDKRPNMRFIVERRSEFYTQPDLSLTSLIEPANKEDTLCSDGNASVKVALSNWGSFSYNFYTDNVTLHVKVTNPVAFSTSTVINAGVLNPGETMVVDVTHSLPVFVPGIYDIEVCLNSPLDRIAYDDTIRGTYISDHLYLPVDENFSNGLSPLVFTSKGNTTHRWDTIMQGTGADTAVRPVFGNKVLSFSGSRGAMAYLSTRQLQLTNAAQPTLEFWYFHDTVKSEDYTDVNILVGGNTYTPLSLLKKDRVYGWKHYEVDLSPYTNGQCIRVLFESMVMTENVVQYIDRIRITSQQDVSVAGIITSELSACDLQNKSWKVILENSTAQQINFRNQPTGIKLDIIDNNTNPSFTLPLRSGILANNSRDTFEITAGFNFTKETYKAMAYLTTPLDSYTSNDTSRATIVVNPSLSVEIKPVSGGTSDCVSGDMEVKQEVVVRNTGNMDLPGSNLNLDIISNSYTFSATGLISDTLLPGDSKTYTFNEYTVPWDATYAVDVEASLVCNPTLVRDIKSITECVNIKDLYILSIDNPSGNEDKVGDEINITASIVNSSDMDEFNNVGIYAEIMDMDGNQINRFAETIPYIGYEETVPYSFQGAYTVPEDTAYIIKVYIASKDDYTYNDTMTIARKTDYNIDVVKIEGLTISMGQNIPNPAGNSTTIIYGIPESGEVIFRIHSVRGQLLYNMAVESESGTNTIEINTSALSAGIYLYSIKYKGQHIVKRMSVKR